MKSNPMGFVVAISLAVALSFVIAGCQAAPTATPTKPPATATTVPPLSQPTPTRPPATAAPAGATSPTAAPATGATPTAAAAASAAKGKLTIVVNTEPLNLDAQLADDSAMRVATKNMYDELTDRDSKTMEVVPMLADKWEQKDATTWRFTLKKGIKFHNGEDFNADAAVWSLLRASNVDLNSRILSYFLTVKSATKVDDSTVDVITDGPDPILPSRVYFMPILAPKWAKENPEEIPIKSFGTGPYKFVEMSRGQFIRMTANDSYAGKTKPAIKDVTVVWRTEPAVRAAMVKTGEAQLARLLGPDQTKEVPKVGRTPTLEVFLIRLKLDQPVLKDKRVRQAMNYAVDRKAIIDTLYAGFATAPKAQPISPAVLGFDPKLEDYPFDMNKAKALVAEAKAAGVPVEQEVPYIVNKGRFPKVEEASESLTNSWKQAGLNIKLNIVERSVYLDALFGTTAAQFKDKAAMLQILHSNELIDASRSTDMFKTGGRQSVWGDPELDKAMDDASKEGDMKKRVEKYNAIFAKLKDEAAFVAMFNLDFIWGMAKNLEWTPRLDDIVRINEMKLGS